MNSPHSQTRLSPQNCGIQMAPSVDGNSTLPERQKYLQAVGPIAAQAQSVESLSMPGSAILNSWKEIANYLGRGVRTVQRWESELGLPVHRPKGKQRSAVLAFPEEISHWLSRTPVGLRGNGNGHPRRGIPSIAPVLLQLARNLRLLVEQMVPDISRQKQRERKKLLNAAQEIVDELTLLINGSDLPKIIDAGGLMGTPVRADIGPSPEQKVGDLEMVVEDRPRPAR